MVRTRTGTYLPDGTDAGWTPATVPGLPRSGPTMNGSMAGEASAESTNRSRVVPWLGCVFLTGDRRLLAAASTELIALFSYFLRTATIARLTPAPVSFTTPEDAWL